MIVDRDAPWCKAAEKKHIDGLLDWGEALGKIMKDLHFMNSQTFPRMEEGATMTINNFVFMAFCWNWQKRMGNHHLLIRDVAGLPWSDQNIISPCRDKLLSQPKVCNFQVRPAVSFYAYGSQEAGDLHVSVLMCFYRTHFQFNTPIKRVAWWFWNTDEFL